MQWEGPVPSNFRFAVKASRFITHIKKLNDPEETVPSFMEAVSLQKKGGPIFFQLPPTFPLNISRLEHFLKQLPKARRYAIELRDPSWHDKAIYELLSTHKIAFCLFDTPEGISPRVMTADFAYVRLRGRDIRNLTSFLGEWKTWLTEHTKQAYVFFDNREEKSLAFGNALLFREITKETI